MAPLRRLGALVATGALTTSGLVASLAAPAQAVGNDPRPASIGAGWLEGQLTNWLIHNDEFDFDDYGLSIDTGFGLAGVGGHDTTVASISAAVADHIGDYIAYPGHTLAGSIAKAAAFAIEAGDDPAAYGGQNLVTDLEARVAGADPIKGRIQDDYTPAPPYEVDFSNVLGQAYAVRVLADAASTKSADATSFLLEQQCPGGFFRLNFADAGAADQTCAAGLATGDSPADTDTTAIAVLMLDKSGIDSKAVGLSIARAEGWLVAHQRADGSFGGGTSTEAPNTNSTGLAGWALGELGDVDAAAKAASWVRAHQADEVTGCANALTDQRGAIGYDDAAVATGRTDGVTTALQDQWRRATSQALPVLTWAPAATGTLDLNGPTGYVRAGRAASFTLAGAAPGEKVCVTGVGSMQRVVTSPTGSATFSLTPPAGTANRLATATLQSSSSASYVLPVLGATTLKVTPARKTKHRGTKVRVVVTGLAPGEHVRLRYRGVTKRTGVADPNGLFVRKIRVGHRLGKARIVAWGEFSAIRHGRAVIRVVR